MVAVVDDRIRPSATAMPAAPASLNASTELHAREIALARSRGLPAEVDPPAVAIRASSSTCSTRPPDAGDITGCLTADIRQADCVAALRIAALTPALT